MHARTVVVLVVLGILVAEAAIAPVNFSKKSGDDKSKKPCTCMNWRLCDGEIDSDVPCSNSYIFVCCIQPDPEVIPQYQQPEAINVIKL